MRDLLRARKYTSTLGPRGNKRPDSLGFGYIGPPGQKSSEPANHKPISSMNMTNSANSQTTQHKVAS